MYTCVVLTGTLEAGGGGVYICRDGGSSQSGKRRNSCGSQLQAETHIRSPLGSAVTSHTRPPADLKGEPKTDITTAAANQSWIKPSLVLDNTHLRNVLCLKTTVTIFDYV